MLIGKMLKKSNIVLVMLFDYGTPERHHTDLNIIRIVSPYQGLNDLSVVHVISLYKGRCSQYKMLIGKMLKKSNIVLVMLFDYGTPERHHTDLNIIRIVSPYQGLNDLSVVHVISLYKGRCSQYKMEEMKAT